MKLRRFSDNTKKLTLYHGCTRKSLEYAINQGALMPRVCAEGGPEAVYLSKKEYEYPCVIKIQVPLSVVGGYQYGNINALFEFINLNDCITMKPIKIGDYDMCVAKIDGIPLSVSNIDEWRQLMHSNNEERKNKFMNHWLSWFGETLRDKLLMPMLESGALQDKNLD